MVAAVTASLGRFLRPRTVALVGASEKRSGVRSILEWMREDIEVFLVHPDRPSVFGRATYPSLGAIGRPIDAVVSLVNAEASIAVAREAADLGAGGLVVGAAGFGEAGPAGRALEQALAREARRGRFPVCGPNCTGLVSLHGGVRFYTGPPQLPRLPGGISVITASGVMLPTIMWSGAARGVGFSWAISPGNEAVTDLCDYLEHLLADEKTRVICLVVEEIRRKERFAELARRALELGKPIVALKLGRTDRARRIARSHTTALAGERWIYEAFFRQVGITSVDTIDELVDVAALFEQLPRERWSEVRTLGVISLSGGGAGLASDMAEEHGFALPEPARLEPLLRPLIPGLTTPNPLDLTGFIMGKADRYREILDAYATAPEFDAVVLQWPLFEADEAWIRPQLEPFAEVAARCRKPMLVAPLDAARLPEWSRDLPRRGVPVAQGIAAALRGLRAMSRYEERRSRARATDAPAPPAEPRPAGEGLVPFAVAMGILQRAGIPVVPFEVVDGPRQARTVARALGDDLVVKVANVMHRSDHDLLAVGVPRGALERTVADLQGRAAALGLPTELAVQPYVRSRTEIFIGVQGESEFGPVVLFGLGGVLVEAMGDVARRTAPLTRADAHEMLGELRGARLLDAFRGQPAWDREAIADALVSASRLAIAGSPWLGSLDVNPLVPYRNGIAAVDVALTLRAPA